MRDVLALRDARLLVIGQAISQAGDWLFSVALIVYLLDATGSPAWVAAASIVRLVPWIVLSPIGGLVADRVDRRRVLIASDLVQLTAMLVLAGVAAVGSAPAVALGVAAVASLAGVAASPSLQASVPMLVDERRLAPLNSLMTAIVSLSMVLGPAVGAVLLFLGSPAVAFALNAITFGVSALCTRAIRTRLNPPSGTDSTANRVTRAAATGRARIGAALRLAGSDLADGARALATSRVAVALVVVGCAILVAYGSQVVLWTVLADERLGAGADSVTLLYVAYGLGGLLATVPAARAASGRSVGPLLGASVAVGGVAVVALAVAGSLGATLALAGLQGLVVTIADVLGITLLQRAVGPAILGRAMGAMDSFTSVALVGGSILAPILLATIGLEGAFVIAGVCLLAAGVLAAVVIRTTPAPEAAPAERVRLLAGLSLFDGAPRFALEGLAAECRELHVEPGTTVIREGDAPDDLYVLVTGAAEVTAGPSGSRVATLGAGDFFGEIGLLKGIPRTASVTVTAAADLLRIDGALFLSLVRTGVAHHGTLGRSVGIRLARHGTTHDQPLGG